MIPRTCEFVVACSFAGGALLYFGQERAILTSSVDVHAYAANYLGGDKGVLGMWAKLLEREALTDREAVVLDECSSGLFIPAKHVPALRQAAGFVAKGVPLPVTLEQEVRSIVRGAIARNGTDDAMLTYRVNMTDYKLGAKA